MKPIEKFISILEQIYPDYRWRGWEMTGEQSFASHGCFLAFRSIMDGYQVNIAFHDYRDLGRKPGYSLERAVFWRRRIHTSLPYWIELTVTDEWARNGRRVVIPRTLFRPDDENFARMSSLFDEIKAKNKILRAQTQDRLSLDQSVLALCDDLSAKTPA